MMADKHSFFIDDPHRPPSPAGEVYRDPVETRAKRYAPVQSVSDSDNRLTVEVFDARHRRKPNLLSATILDHAISAKDARAKPPKTYRGKECSKCSTTERERGTDLCMYCHGPIGFRLKVDARRTKKREKRAMLQQKLTLKDTATLRQVSLAVHDAAIFQAYIRVPRAFWVQMGKPKRVDVTSPMVGEWTIAKGTMTSFQISPQGLSSGVIAISASKLGISHMKRAATLLDAECKHGVVHVQQPDEDWRGTTTPQPDYLTETAEGEAPAEDHNGAAGAEGRRLSAIREKAAALFAPPPEPPPPAPTILQDQTPPPPPEPLEGEVGLSVTKNGSSAFAMRFAIPSAMLGALGDPPYVTIDGQAHEGFKITPRAYDGLRCNYKTGTNVYVQSGLGNRRLDKGLRKQIRVAAVVKDGIIRVSGPDHDWIRATPQWRPDTPPAPAMVARLPASPATGVMPASPETSPVNGHVNGHVNGEKHVETTGNHASVRLELRPGETIATLKVRLQETLGLALALKLELETRTGLEFRVTSVLGLLVK